MVIFYTEGLIEGVLLQVIAPLIIR
jgi:hypothetical protein